MIEIGVCWRSPSPISSYIFISFLTLFSFGLFRVLNAMYVSLVTSPTVAKY